MGSAYKAQLLGGLRVWKDDQEITCWRSERARALLAYLLVYADRDLSRSQVAETIWYLPDADERGRAWNPDRASAYLNRELSQLRNSLGWDREDEGSPLQTSRHFVRLNTERISSDLAQFRRLVRQSERTRDASERQALLREAALLARVHGPLLPDIRDEWAEEPRHLFAGEYGAVVRDLSERTEIASVDADQLMLATRRDADAFVEYIRDAWHMLRSPEQARWFRELDGQQLRTLYLAEWETRQNAVPRILVNMSVRVMWQQTRIAEQVLDVFRHNLEVRRCVAEIPRPYVTSIAGGLAHLLGDYRLAKRYLQQALTEFRRRNDLGCIAGTLANLGYLAHTMGAYDEGLSIARELESLYTELGEMGFVSQNIASQGIFLRLKGDCTAAFSRLQAAVDLAHQIDDVNLKVGYRIEIGLTLWESERRDEALAYLAEVYRLADYSGIASLRYGISSEQARLMAEAGDLSRALASTAIALEACLSLEFWGGFAHSIRSVSKGWLQCPAEQPRHLLDTLARMVGAEADVRDRHHLPLPPVERSNREQVRAKLRDRLGPKAFRAALLAGRSLSEETVLQLVRSSSR